MTRAKSHKTVRVRIKWAVCDDETYISGPGGTIAWTYDRKEAERHAKLIGGKVVDADKLSSAKWRAKHFTERLRRKAAASR